MANDDLVVLAISGVQRFIEESRRTADLAAGSEIVAQFGREAASHLTTAHHATLVFPPALPTPDAPQITDGAPNRIVALVPAGQGAPAATDTERHLHQLWTGWIERTFRDVPAQPDPGWPKVQWACAPAGVGDYPQQWDLANRALAARKEARDFQQSLTRGRNPCELSPQWPEASLPPNTPPRHSAGDPARTTRTNIDQLSVTGWVKRCWHQRNGEHSQQSGFPATNAIASAPYRAALLEQWNHDISEAARKLHDAVGTVLGEEPYSEYPVPGLPGPYTDPVAEWLRAGAGIWVYPETWHRQRLERRYRNGSSDPEFADAVTCGKQAAARLIELSTTMTPPQPIPATHLAVLVQDLDSMGDFLKGHSPGRDGSRVTPGVDGHRDVSQLLQQAAGQQRRTVNSVENLGSVVYAGGDDLLALLPARTALRVAQQCRDGLPPALPTVSTALLFFHHASPLQDALVRAHEALEQAKSRDGKHGLAVGYVQPSGSAATCVTAWQPTPDQPTGAERLRLFPAATVPAPSHSTPDHPNHPAPALDARLSPRLVADLERSRDGLDALEQSIAGQEVRRLVARHVHGTRPLSQQEHRDAAAEFSTALEQLSRTGQKIDWATPARVAAFLGREAR
ncbi:type III-B CRISPR-associated protein Cas10/Cmr2 [Lipingzhangella sp. LS1_29]|uniref:Type III-B CRISPR-associated protein Cas10/Cmr2 n=1 Tax=Lipingzhangella rawalii TaxID=2055835 RepID=A0ABU2H331_9ACTN|nr:type III-B CRISPR-associated protein Cas10/Cmr2 [Lipingzhangella rawalii]MDS1269708.1 type III-B CRISPR-associated protein Cas10/Cmr2 [Lipingzhangella rawalii]